MDLLLLPNLDDNDSKVQLNPGVFGPPLDNIPLLDELVKIKISDEGRSVRPFSTPSVYRRALDLYSAVNNPGEWPGVSEVFTKQWRKMVALLALSATYSMNIKFQKVDLTNPPVDSAFLQICSSTLMLPLNKDAFDGMDWTSSCYNIILDYKPPAIEQTDGQLVLGATSPSTLFFPSEDFEDVIDKHHKKNFDIDHLEDEDLSCVYDWVLWLRIQKDSSPHINDTTVLKTLIDGFLSDLLVRITKTKPLEVAMRLPSDKRYPGWVVEGNKPVIPKSGIVGRFKEDAFTPEGGSVGNGVEMFNFSVKQERDAKEWRALFIGLALNDIKNYKITRAANEFIVASDGGIKCIAAFHEDAWIVPGLGIATNLGIEVSNHEFVLNHFEWLCVYQYLTRLEMSILLPKNALLGQHINEFKTYIKDKKLMPHIAKTSTEVWVEGASGAEVLEWEDNRFTGGNAAATGLDAFDFAIHKHNAPFFEDIPYLGVDGAGDARKEITRPWFNVLAFIAFKDIRHLPVKYEDIISTMTLPAGLVSTKRSSPLYSNHSSYMLQGVFLNGDMIAASTADTLFAVVTDNEPRMQDAFYNLLTRERYPRGGFGTKNMHSRTLERKSRGTPNPDFVVDSALYDFEVVLFAKWLEALILGLSTRNGADVKIEDKRDKRLLTELIHDKKRELLSNIGIDNTAAVDFSPYFDASETCFAYETSSTLKYFYGAIKNNLFLDRLVMYAGDDQLECEIENHEKDGASHTILGGIYTCINEKLEQEEIGGGGAILPFTEAACKHMYQSTDNRNPGDPTSMWYGLGFVEVYRGLYENRKVHEVSVLSKSNNTFPMIKQYAVGDNIESANAIEDILPAVAIWPDVEIEGWKNYAVSIIGTADNCDNVQFPSFIMRINNGPAPLEIGTLAVANFRDDRQETVYVTPEFKTFTVQQYPRMLDVHYNGRLSGCLFVQPRWLKADGTAGESYFPSGSETVDVGIDFGTTNSVAYIKGLGDTPEPFDLSLVESNYVTTKFAEGFDIELPASIASQRRWIFDSDLGDAAARGYFSSTLMCFNNGLVPLPFIHANIYRISGLEIGNFSNGSLLERSRSYKFDMKWAGNAAALRAFLGQFSLMCCVAAVKLRSGKIGEVKFKVSYPTSLPETQRQDFESAWRGEVLTQVKGFSSFSNATVEFYNESISAGLACIFNDGSFFRNEENNDPFVHGFVCMDIGGGSMDISVLQRRNLAEGGDVGVSAHLSIPFAAQYILTAGIVDQNNRTAQGIIMKFFEHLNVRMNELTAGMTRIDGQLPKRVELLQGANAGFSRGLADTRNLIPKEFVHAIDTYVVNCSRIVEKLNPLGRAENLSHELNRIKEIPGAANSMKHLSKVKMCLASLMYFIGGMVKDLKESKRFNLADGGELNVFLAGNGSKIIDWVLCDGDNLPPGVNRDSHGILPLYVKAGLKDAHCTVNFLPSEMPKNEVAYGLVYAKATGDKNVRPLNTHDIDKLIYDHASNQPVFKSKAGNIYAEHRIEEKDYKHLSVDAIAEHLTNLINPDYKKDKLLDVIAHFILSFYTISPVDFKRIFSVDATTIEIARDVADRYIAEVMSDAISGAVAGDSQIPPISVRTYNGYAVLKFAMLILKKI